MSASAARPTCAGDANSRTNAKTDDAGAQVPSCSAAARRMARRRASPASARTTSRAAAAPAAICTVTSAAPAATTAPRSRPNVRALSELRMTQGTSALRRSAVTAAGSSVPRSDAPSDAMVPSSKIFCTPVEPSVDATPATLRPPRRRSVASLRSGRRSATRRRCCVAGDHAAVADAAHSARRRVMRAMRRRQAAKASRLAQGHKSSLQLQVQIQQGRASVSARPQIRQHAVQK